MKNEIKQSVNVIVDQLYEILTLHEQLLIAVKNKQKNMRAGNMSELESWSAREQFLIDRIKESDVIRQEECGKLSSVLELSEQPTITLLADKVGEPDRSRLLAMAGGIRNLADQIYQVNQVNDAVTREILNCFAQIQRQISTTHCDLGLYDPSGRKQMGSPIRILDAVG
jgi:hypothetical protein